MEQELKLYPKDLVALLMRHFNDNEGLVARWMRSRNPLLGDVSPREMLQMGRERKLMDFVRSSLEGEMP